MKTLKLFSIFLIGSAISTTVTITDTNNNQTATIQCSNIDGNVYCSKYSGTGENFDGFTGTIAVGKKTIANCTDLSIDPYARPTQRTKGNVQDHCTLSKNTD